MRLREYAIPMQALLAVTFCFGLVWMVYTMAFFDATPPTALEVRAVVTQAPEINELKTAAALTVNALFGIGPTQILLPTMTPSFAPTRTSMVAGTPIAIPYSTITGTATTIFGLTATSDHNSPFIPTRTLTPTRQSTATLTLVPTSTPHPPTGTATDVVPTATDPPPTLTSTPKPPPTDTAQPPPTNTAQPPPPTDIPTDPPTPVNTPAAVQQAR